MDAIDHLIKDSQVVVSPRIKLVVNLGNYESLHAEMGLEMIATEGVDKDALNKKLIQRINEGIADMIEDAMELHNKIKGGR